MGKWLKWLLATALLGPILANAQTRPSVPNMVTLYAPVNFYVNNSSGSPGSDSNDCLSATVSGGHGPCLTMQHAYNVALGYPALSQSVVLNLATSTNKYQGFCAEGSPAFSGDTGGSATYVIFSGAGASNTTIGDPGLNGAFTMCASNGAHLLFENLTIDVPNFEAGFFVQNPGTVVEFGTGVTFHGDGSSAFGAHVEGYGLLESEATNTITFTGSFGYMFALGATGYLELDPEGTGVIACSGSPTFSTAMFLLQYQATVFIGSGWSFSGCGTPTAVPFDVQSLSVLYTATTIPGSGAGYISSGGRILGNTAPTIVGTPSGCGSGCTVGIGTAAGSRSGKINMETGTGPSNAGSFVVDMKAVCVQEDDTTTAWYSVFPAGATWPNGTIMYELSVSGSQVTIAWNSNGTSLSATTAYSMAYSCNG